MKGSDGLENKKVLVVGSGGREHALVWKLAQSPHVIVYCAPGNAGTGQIGTNVPIVVTDLCGLLKFALEEKIDLTVVGPEVPLVAGIVDLFRKNGLVIFGPTAVAARLEGSKIWAKQVMDRCRVPTAPWQWFGSPVDAIAWLRKQPDRPWVVKPDGLTGGKGVLICRNRQEAQEGVIRIMIDREFKEAGGRIIIEECLEGDEVSLLGICSNGVVTPLSPAQDYKRRSADEESENTGGMGAYCPTDLSETMVSHIVEKIMQPIVDYTGFSGLLYAGLMLTRGGPKVLEYNVRFGDPETQVVLPLMESDLLKLLRASATGQPLGQIAWSGKKAVTVVAVHEEYPVKGSKGEVIRGLGFAESIPNLIIFHAGTEIDDDQVVTNGGRILNFTGIGDTYAEAIEIAYRGFNEVHFIGGRCRSDIACEVDERG